MDNYSRKYGRMGNISCFFPTIKLEKMLDSILENRYLVNGDWIEMEIGIYD